MNLKKSNPKKIVKILVDILMYLDFIFLMSHGTVRNLTVHALSGIGLFALFIAHHILNIWFYKTTAKGKYNANRIFLSATAWILFVLMILMAVSSMLASGMVFDFSPFVFSETARTIHTMSSSWGFVVMSFHLGLHTDSALVRLEKKICGKAESKAKQGSVSSENAENESKSKPKNVSAPKLVVNIVYALVFLAGCFAFYKTQLHFYLFHLSAWKLSAPNLFISYLEYFGITLIFIVLAHWIKELIRTKNKIKK